MNHTLTIDAQQRPEILERVLRVTRHRGFNVQSLNMEQQAEGRQVRITVTVDSERPIDQLRHQLSKLIDVAQVEEVLQKDVLQQHAFQIRA